MNDVSDEQLVKLLLNCAEHNCSQCTIAAKGQTCIDALIKLTAERLQELLKSKEQ